MLILRKVIGERFEIAQEPGGCTGIIRRSFRRLLRSGVRGCVSFQLFFSGRFYGFLLSGGSFFGSGGFFLLRRRLLLIGLPGTGASLRTGSLGPGEGFGGVPGRKGCGRSRLLLRRDRGRRGGRGRLLGVLGRKYRVLRRRRLRRRLTGRGLLRRLLDLFGLLLRSGR
jgi:hypothetical protein